MYIIWILYKTFNLNYLEKPGKKITNDINEVQKCMYDIY